LDILENTVASVKIISPVPRHQVLAAQRRANIIKGNNAERSNVEYNNFSLMNDLLYRGRQDRLDRYRIYDAMDQDVDIARALDMIAEHCTNDSPKTGMPLQFDLDEDEITAEDVDILYDSLDQWNARNEWKRMLWRVIRNTIKYGDSFFIRDPKTFKLHQVAAKQVVGIYVNRDERKIEAYHFRDLNFVIDDIMNFNVPQVPASSSYGANNQFRGTPANEIRKDAVVLEEHVVHISMSEGHNTGGNGQHDDIWPFGESFLEQIYKDYKKRDMLESAAVIHRMQRAPSRRVWKVDIGKMRADRVNSYMKRFKDELLHKRIPTKFGGQDSMDAVYNPVSQMEDIFLPVGADGRGSSVENLEGQQWNGLEDLEYFNSKLLRGLRVPTSFMLGPEEGGAQFNDGRVGTAYIQEIQFAKFCKRIQALIDKPLDAEFKLFLKARGLQIHAGDFGLEFTPPMNFEEQQEGALDADRLNRLGQAAGVAYISKRFALMKYAGWSQDEIVENEIYWKEENITNAAKGDAQLGGGGMGGGMGGGGLGGFNLPGGGGGFDAGSSGIGANPLDNLGADAGAGAPGGDLGMGAPPGGAAPGGTGIPASTAPGIEMKRIITKKSTLLESKRKDRSQQSKEEDNLFNTSTDTDTNKNTKPLLTLKHIRKLRLEKEKTRRDLLRRMELVGRMYSGGGADQNPF